MYRRQIERKRGNGTLPPTFSRTTAKTFFDGLVQRYPEHGLTDEYLDAIKISEGRKSGLLGGLRWLGVINRKEIVLNDPNLPAKLRDVQTRKQIFKEMLAAYPDEMFEAGRSKLKYRNLDQLTQYFEEWEINSDTSERAAVLFGWLAEQAGYKAIEEPKPAFPNQGRDDNQYIRSSAPITSNQPRTEDANTRARVAALQALIKASSTRALNENEMESLLRLTEDVGHFLP